MLHAITHTLTNKITNLWPSTILLHLHNFTHITPHHYDQTPSSSTTFPRFFCFKNCIVNDQLAGLFVGCFYYFLSFFFFFLENNFLKFVAILRHVAFIILYVLIVRNILNNIQQHYGRPLWRLRYQLYQRSIAVLSHLFFLFWIFAL